MMNALEELTGFRHQVSSAYHPQSNRLDERLNQTLKAALQKLVNDKKDDWHQLLDNVPFAYRTSRQDSTKYTPFFLLYGRKARLPIDTEHLKRKQHPLTSSRLMGRWGEYDRSSEEDSSTGHTQYT